MAESVTVTITSEDKVKTIPATLSVSTKEEALLKAGMIWGGCWVLMIGAVFIPIIHFFAVPAFFLIGPLAGWLIYKLFADRKTIKFEEPPKCPKCEASIVLPGTQEDWPVHNVCMACKTSFAAEY